MNSMHLTIPSETQELPKLRHHLRAWLESECAPVGTREQILLALHEAAANAVEHAHGAGTVQISAAIDGCVVTIEVRDCGHWQADRQASDERGRGLMLINGLIDDVSIVPDADGTTVTLRQSLTAA